MFSATPLKHSTGNSSHWNKSRKYVLKATISICRWHDYLYGKFQRICQKQKPKTNKEVQHGHRIKDQHTQISCMSKYSQWTYGNRN